VKLAGEGIDDSCTYYEGWRINEWHSRWDFGFRMVKLELESPAKGLPLGWDGMGLNEGGGGGGLDGWRMRFGCGRGRGKISLLSCLGPFFKPNAVSVVE